MVEVTVIRTDDICIWCHKRCERIDPKHDFFICCNCSGSYIDSLCDTCQKSSKPK